MKRVWVVLAIVTFTAPFWLMGGLYLWINLLARGKHQVDDVGMRISAEKRLAMELAGFVDAYSVLIASVMAVVFWAIAAGLGYLVLHKRSPEARG